MDRAIKLESDNLREAIQNSLIDQYQSTSEQNKSIFKRMQRNALFNNYYFPLDTDDDLNNMEKKIWEESTGFRSLLVNDLIFIGGKDTKDMVKRLMTKLFTMELLSGFSLNGYTTGGITISRRFLDLTQIHGVIIEAVQGKFRNTKEVYINEKIRDYLNDASYYSERRWSILILTPGALMNYFKSPFLRLCHTFFSCLHVPNLLFLYVNNINHASVKFKCPEIFLELARSGVYCNIEAVQKKFINTKEEYYINEAIRGYLNDAK